MWLAELLNKLPIWAYGLECHICKKTFIGPREHYNEVMKGGYALGNKHEGKIPQLR